jgi:DNA-binding MarR family transcriptional regulator
MPNWFQSENLDVSSVPVPSWIFDLGLTAAELAVAVALLGFADFSSGSCWPSLNAIAQRAGCSRSTTQRAIKKMRDIGLVKAEHRDGETDILTFQNALSECPF